MRGELIAGQGSVKVDIAIAADIRVGDTAAPCHAAAARALAAAGYSVAILPVMARSIPADPYRIDPGFRDLLSAGTIRRVAGGARVDCALALAFDARLFGETIEIPPGITADHRLVTVERPGALAALDRLGLDRLRARAADFLGGPVTWCAASVTSLDALACAVPDWPVAVEIWSPVVPDHPDIGADAEERARPAVGRARIARSRPHADWPDAFLNSPLVTLRERGGADILPSDWPGEAPVENWPDISLSMPQFLAKLDLLANPDIAADDPVPTEALIALCAGVIPCLPVEYRELFGTAAIYGRGAELLQAIIDLKLDPVLMASTREAGSTLVLEVFSPDLFAARVRGLIGAPKVKRFAPAIHAEPPSRVLFYSTNGIGMGHLTRQLAVARRLPERLRPAFVSHSRAVDTVRAFGFPGEHLPYHAAYGEARAHWNAGLADALETALAFYRPRVIVFDGNVPFRGLLAALTRRTGTASVWIRRGMWGPGRDLEALDRAAAFDLVVEPLDPAWSRDDGPTMQRRPETRVVPPVRILDGSELPDRAVACDALGLDARRTNILIATGSGNNFDMAAITSRALDRLTGRADLGVAVAEWQIAQDRLDLPDGVARLTGYPFAQYIAAFDFAVAAPGYNTFCEHLAHALPTIWVPNENAQMDRQIDRAQFADDIGLGRIVRSSAPFDLAAALSVLLDPGLRADMATAGARFAERNLAENGAGEIAEIITDLAGSTVTARSAAEPRGGS